MDRKILWVGIGAFLFVALAEFAALLFLNPPGFRGAAYMEPLPPAPEIELTQADGGTFRLSDQRGRIVLLFFGYTSCPDVCPTTLAGLKLVLEELGDKAGSVQVLFISIDPGRDTPERAQEYVNHFDPSFIGLSGSQAELEKIWKDYGVFREIVEGASAAEIGRAHV